MQNIRELLTSIVIKEGRYLRAKEIGRLSNVSLYTIYRIIEEGLEEFQRNLGFTKDRSLITREQYIERIKNLSILEDKFLTDLEISKKLNISRSTLRKHNIDTTLLQEELGFLRKKKKPPGAWNKGLVFKEKINTRKPLTKDSIETSIISLIEKYKCYCPTRVVAKELGVSASLIRSKNIDITEINNALGYYRTFLFFEMEILCFLEELFPDQIIERQKWFADCLSPSGNCLFFDFCIPSLKLLIEADGPCHYKDDHPWYSTGVLERDALKNNYAIKNKYILVRIPYTNSLDKNYILKYLTESPLELEELQRSGKLQT